MDFSTSNTLYVYNFPMLYEKDDIIHIFETFGEVVGAQVCRGVTEEGHNGLFYVYAIVEFMDREEAKLAMNMLNGKQSLKDQQKQLIVSQAPLKGAQLANVSLYALSPTPSQPGVAQQASTQQAYLKYSEMELEKYGYAENSLKNEFPLNGIVPVLGCIRDALVQIQTFLMATVEVGHRAPRPSIPVAGGMGMNSDYLSVHSGCSNASNLSSISSNARGPPGANIFVYHLPSTVDDDQLNQLFAPFGQVLSTRVFIDNKTGESKGFGFVSYSSPQSATLAIAQMNGLHIANKRLKVELKKG